MKSLRFTLAIFLMPIIVAIIGLALLKEGWCDLVENYRNKLVEE